MAQEHVQLRAIAERLVNLSNNEAPLHESIDQLCDLADQLTSLAADTMISRYALSREPLFPGDKS